MLGVESNHDKTTLHRARLNTQRRGLYEWRKSCYFVLDPHPPFVASVLFAQQFHLSASSHGTAVGGVVRFGEERTGDGGMDHVCALCANEERDPRPGGFQSQELAARANTRISRGTAGYMSCQRCDGYLGQLVEAPSRRH